MNFNDKTFRPMLIGKEAPCFDDDEFIYELKLDGVRCLAYLDETGTFLQNKRGVQLNAKFPELKHIHQQVKKRCVLDGELYIFEHGNSNFFEVQRRTLTADRFKIQRHAKTHPATFTAFDILFLDDKSLLKEPLMKRKKLLEKTVIENDRFNISRYIETAGSALFALAKERNLEGIVAKRKNSLYTPEKKTNQWIKSKNLLDDDFIVLGYIPKDNNIVSLILAQYDHDELHYKGHVTMGVSLPYLFANSNPTSHIPFEEVPSGNDDAIWIQPWLVGIVKFMEYTAQGGLRQPVFKGFRNDKEVKDCISK